ACMETYDVMAPVLTDGKLNYQTVTDAGEIVLTDDLPVKSAKEAVFPRVEALLRFEKEEVSVVQKLKPVLLVGAKPCDLEGFAVLDMVFSGKRWKLDDPFYENRRQCLTIIGMGCREEKAGCFCKSRGIDAKYSGNCDGFLHADGSGFVYEEITEAGSGLFAGEAVPTPPHDNPPKAVLQITEAEEKIFDAMPWEEYVLGCIGCGTCTYVCPTCHCFALRDSDTGAEVIRNRLWDSCMYPNFTLHGGGHNPRDSKWARYRQRVMHKYVYIRDNFGLTACTGCGRCVRSCPGGVNIRRVVEDIQRRLEVSEDE
ncbi:MAG: 4Fe-4S dicluster domain-containing protein, partial [Clostridiales bacterium]|nr:4Fe-4S dicluster domain-containing protein [Clostridiales bacterium]